MSSVDHDRSMLGAYALGALDPREAQLVHEHLATCAECRREVADLADLRTAMDDVPPEAFLDGPPDGGELVLQRTLRAARAQLPVVAQPRARRSFALVAASVVVAAAVALGGGILIGRQTAPDTVAQPPLPANTRHAEGTDPQTGARLVADVTPQAGWVRIRVAAFGIPRGEPCEIFAVPNNGPPVLAGSWLVSENGARNGTTLDGSALLDPTEVRAIEIRNTSGKLFVSVPV
jgi:anti-sigma factor RsiW